MCAEATGPCSYFKTHIASNSSNLSQKFTSAWPCKRERRADQVVTWINMVGDQYVQHCSRTEQSQSVILYPNPQVTSQISSRTWKLCLFALFFNFPGDTHEHSWEQSYRRWMQVCVSKHTPSSTVLSKFHHLDLPQPVNVTLKRFLQKSRLCYVHRHY